MIELDKVTDIASKQSILEMLFGVGSVQVSSAGSS